MSLEIMQPPTPTVEHLWLKKFVGQWQIEMSCDGPPDAPMSVVGTETFRMIGDVWVMGEGVMPGGCLNIYTFGYDPALKSCVGSFISSMMTMQWIYSGQLDEAKNTMTMDARGPSFSGDGTMCDYKDIYAFESDDVRTLKSIMKQPDGSWKEFMFAKATRIK